MQRGVKPQESIPLEPEKAPAPEMTIDMAIDKLAHEVAKSLAPEKRPRIAVVDLLGPNDDHTQLGSFISQKLITKLFMLGRFEKVLERKLLQDLLVQQRIEMEGYFDQSTVQSIRGKIGVDAVVMGFIPDCGSRVNVNVRLIDTNGEILSVGEAQTDKDQVANMLKGVRKATLTVAINPDDIEASVAVGEKVVKSIDGIAIFRDLPQGNRSIIVTARGYEMKQEGVYVTHDRSIRIHLSPKKVTLTVRVTPPQGEIIFDGENKGKAPEGVMVLRDVLSGKHTILARAEGYLPEMWEIELYENQAVSINLSSICPYPSYAKEAGPLRDPIVIEVIHLDYANAEELASVVAPLLSKEGQVVAHRHTNSLIIKDRASLVKRLVRIIKGTAYP